MAFEDEVNEADYFDEDEVINKDEEVQLFVKLTRSYKTTTMLILITK